MVPKPKGTLMDEQQIAAQLKQNVTTPPDTVLTPTPLVDTTYGQAAAAQSFELDEMTQYKLHDLFGQQYQPHDEVTRQRLSYIYQEVSNLVEEKEYGFVAAKIVDLQRIIGINQSEERLYKLYQWLRLNKVRLNTEAEMASIV